MTEPTADRPKWAVWSIRAVVFAAGYAVVLIALLGIGRHLTVPDQATAMQPPSGGIGAAAHQLMGRPGTTDFLVDYASAAGLTHNLDAYENSTVLTKHVGVPWEIPTSNPHPPTLLPLVLPFTILGYQQALAAWALAMVIVFVLTIRLVGVSWWWAVIGGVVLALIFPGAYGIGNPVPLIGLGVAMAYRYRYEPIWAGVGLALATAPKVSGLVLFIPFVIARRFKAVAVGAGALVVLAVIPIAFQSNIWSRYLDLGVKGADANAARDDNGSILHLFVRHQSSELVALVLIAIVALVAAFRTRDTFWPMVWVAVAALPIAWMYSLLTFIPVAARIARRGERWATGAVVVAAGLTFASPPLGHWPTWVLPVVTVIMLLAIQQTPATDDERFWIPEAWERHLPWARTAEPIPTS